MGEWKTIKSHPRDVTVLIGFRNSHGKWRTIKACYFSSKTREAATEFDWGECDEATGTYYCPEGWYEDVYAETGYDYSFHAIPEVEPTHWMELPGEPDDA